LRTASLRNVGLKRVHEGGVTSSVGCRDVVQKRNQDVGREKRRVSEHVAWRRTRHEGGRVKGVA